MADQIIQCPFCQGQLSISEELIGREVQCPLCQQILIIGEEETPAPPPMPPQMPPQMTPPPMPPQMTPPPMPGQGGFRPGIPPQMPGMQPRPGMPGMPGTYNNPYGAPAAPMRPPLKQRMKKAFIIGGIVFLVLVLLNGGYILFALLKEKSNSAAESAAMAKADEISQEEMLKVLEITKNGTRVDGLKDKSISRIAIPEGVTEIKRGAFENCTGLTEVRIPASVTFIGGEAFANCTNLKTLFIPEGVVEIEGGLSGVQSIQVAPGNKNFTVDKHGALIDIKNKRLLYLPPKFKGNYFVPADVTTIGGGIDYGAFTNCHALTGVTLHSKITEIGPSAFANCSRLKRVNIPSVYEIKYSTFENCSALTEVNIASGVTKIDTAAFQNCSSLTSITIPESVSAIDDRAFKGCSSLTDICFNGKMRFLGREVFAYCTSLESITLPEGIENIRDDTFYECTRLKKVVLPKSVTEIRGRAFMRCNSLTDINLPEKLTSIDYQAFEGCSALRNITIPPRLIGLTAGTFRGCSNLELFIPKWMTLIEPAALSGVKSVKVEPGNERYATIPPGALVQYFGFHKFKRFELLYFPPSYKGSFRIPGGIDEIKNEAFYNCSGLTDIEIPDSVSKIGLKAFDGCINLNCVTIPPKVTDIRGLTFRGVKSVKVAAGNKNFTVDKHGALIDTKHKDLLYLPPSFKGEYIIPEQIKVITFGAFNNSELDSVVISKNLDGCSDGVFTGIKSVKVAAGNKIFTVDEYGAVFKNASVKSLIYVPQSLKGSYTVPEGTEHIRDDAFMGCSGLTEIIIPASVTYIGSGAFENCTALSSVKIADHEKEYLSVYGSAFKNCTSLKKIVLPAKTNFYEEYDLPKNCRVIRR